MVGDFSSIDDGYNVDFIDDFVLMPCHVEVVDFLKLKLHGRLVSHFDSTAERATDELAGDHHVPSARQTHGKLLQTPHLKHAHGKLLHNSQMGFVMSFLTMKLLLDVPVVVIDGG